MQCSRCSGTGQEPGGPTSERITETFRGVNCKRHAYAYRDQMKSEGWREASFSGVSGVGGYKSCSITLVRSTVASTPTG